MFHGWENHPGLTVWEAIATWFVIIVVILFGLAIWIEVETKLLARTAIEKWLA